MSPSTASYLQLRYLLRNDSTFPNEIICIESDLREIRRQSLDLFSSADRNFRSKFYDLFLECWRIFSSMKNDVTNRFALPNLYHSKSLERNLRACAETLFMVEIGDRSPGNHPIYYGCKGVGKTTVLDAIGKIGAVLLEKAVPLYWSYEYGSNFYPSLAALVEASRQLEVSVMADPSIDHSDTFFSILRRCENTEVTPITTAEKSSTDIFARPIFLLDEFATLYTTNVQEVGARVLVEIRTCGKTTANVAIFLAASCTNIERYVYPSGEDARVYPNLNNTVFFSRIIHPIRDKNDLAEYAKIRYPAWDIDPEHLLDVTGGVGRCVTDLYRNSEWVSPQIADKVFSDKALFDVFSVLIASRPPSVARQDRELPWPIWHMGYASALELVVNRGYTEKEAVSKINSWCDSLIFHKDDAARLSFLIPASAREVLIMIDADIQYHFAMVLSLTLTGFEGGSAGHSNEDFLCEFMHSYTSVEVPHTSNGTLVLGELVAMLENGSSARPVSDVNMLIGDLLKWRKGGCETGIDRIWLTLDKEVIIVNGLQIKTGKLGTSMTPGKLKTQRLQKTCATVDVTTVAGVLVKAERGFVSLLTGLKSTFPQVRFRLGELHIFTTKNALEARNKFCEQNEACEVEFTVSEDCSRQLRQQPAIDADAPASFLWHVHDGQKNWIQAILPVSVRGLFG